MDRILYPSSFERSIEVEYFPDHSQVCANNAELARKVSECPIWNQNPLSAYIRAPMSPTTEVDIEEYEMTIEELLM